MRTSLSLGNRAWQGLALELVHDDYLDPPLNDIACEVATELNRLGRRVPVAVLLTALELHGFEDPHAAVLGAVAEAPGGFVWSQV